MVNSRNRHCRVLIGISLLVSIVSAAVTNEVAPDVNSRAVRGKKNLEVTSPLVDITSPLTAPELWENLFTDTLPAGVTNFKVEFTTGCNYPEAAGSYSNLPPFNGIEPKDGIILTSGQAVIAIGPNDETGAGLDQNGGGSVDPGNGDDDLTAMVPGYVSYDACLLTLTFTTDTSVHGISFDFIYGTDEFSEWVNSDYNDIFCTFLDGENICFDHDSNLICVNNNFFKIDNENAPYALDLEYDGFTPLLRTSDTLTEGDHTLKFAICDMGDQILDAGVFLNNFKFEYSGQGTNPVPVTIVVEQYFTVYEDAPEGTHVGDILVNTTIPSAVTMMLINNIPEFDVSPSDPFGITVATGANLNYSIQDKYYPQVEASTGSGANLLSDTAIVVIQVLEAGTGIIDNSNKGNIFTCPVVIGDNLVINGLTEGAYTLGITNSKGQQILYIENGSKTNIDISTVPSGIYFVTLTSKNRKVYNKIYINR